MNIEHKTAGQLSFQALHNNTKYDALEVGYGMTDDVFVELRKCADANTPFMDQDEFCLVMLKGEDNVLINLIRRKFFAWHFLPKPRHNQAVFLYNKKTDNLKKLWILPCKLMMTDLHKSLVVHKRYKTMKMWSDIYQKGIDELNPSVFWDFIRKENNIKMLSEFEYISRNKTELIKASVDRGDVVVSDTLNFCENLTEQIVHSNIP